jgi:purine nucleosidase/pyrimidine-specific ribonucleoside hydrolase
MKLLIDTDIGDDIDDALALAWALKLNLDIVGITTVYRDAEKRAKIAKRILELSGREDIPVYYGENGPINPNAVTIGKFNYEVEYNGCLEANGVSYIAECAEKYGEELTILALGPQTNLAMAYLNYPEAMHRVGRVVIMGGAFFCHSDEWNIAGDPTAAKIVMASGRNLEYVNWDLTRHAEIGKENTEFITSIHETSLRGFVARLVEDWTRRNTYFPILHDPLALIYCIEPSMFQTKKITSRVIDEGPFSGVTLNTELWYGYQNRKTWEEKGNIITVCTSADLPELTKRFMADVFDKEGM